MEEIYPTFANLSNNSTFDIESLFNNVATPQKPSPIPVEIENIPQEMRNYRQFVCWKYALKGEKWTKLPLNPTTLQAASVTKAENWNHFDVAVEAYLKNSDQIAGIGFVLTENDPYVCIDLDKCISEKDFELIVEEQANKFVENFKTYTEISPSGTGLHLFTEATIKKSFKPTDERIEVYSDKRFICLTGQLFRDNSVPIEKRQELIDKLCAYLEKKAQAKRAQANVEKDISEDISTVENADYLKSWDALRKELGNRISAHPSARKNSSGKYDCRGICHNGEGNTGLFYDPIRNQAICNRGCTQDQILRAFDLPIEPSRKGRLSRIPAVDYETFPVGKTLEEILNALQPINLKEEAGIPEDKRLTERHQYVLTVMEVMRKAKELNSGLSRKFDFFYVFNGQYWEQASEDLLSHFLSRSAEKIGVNPMLARDFVFRGALFKQLVSDSYFPPLEESDKTRINLKNGTFEIDLTGGKLREFRREDFLTYQLPFAYDPDAECSMWKSYLNDVLPDQKLQDILAEFVGYAFTKGLKLESCLFLYGPGNGGKSVFLDVITSLFGPENICHYRLSSLVQKEHYRAQLANKLLNYSGDIGPEISDSDIYKTLTSGEHCEARLLYGQSFTMIDYAKMIFNTNNMPRSDDYSDGFFRRFLIIPFNYKVPKEKKDVDLAKKIIASELSGVFNWVLEGLRRLLKARKFTESKAADDALAAYRKDSDSVISFIEEFIESRMELHSSSMLLNDLYPHYVNYCKSNGLFPVSNKKLSARLKERGYHASNSRGKGVEIYFTKSEENGYETK